MNRKTDWAGILKVASLPLFQLLLGAMLLFNPDGAIAVIFRIIGWLLVLVALMLAFSLAADRQQPVGRVLGALGCGFAGAMLIRNPLFLAAGTGKILGALLLLRVAAGLLRGGKLAANPVKAVLAELPELILGALLLFSPMAPSRLILGVIGAGLILAAVFKLFSMKRELMVLAEPRDPKIIDADE